METATRVAGRVPLKASIPRVPRSSPHVWGECLHDRILSPIILPLSSGGLWTTTPAERVQCRNDLDRWGFVRVLVPHVTLQSSAKARRKPASPAGLWLRRFDRRDPPRVDPGLLSVNLIAWRGTQPRLRPTTNVRRNYICIKCIFLILIMLNPLSLR